jgi:hypothetical protein
VVPPGSKAVWHHFQTVGGQYAMIINQTAFIRIDDDYEEEVNGCTLVIALDPSDSAIARTMLERWAREKRLI